MSDPPAAYAYPPAHLHVNAAPESYGHDKPFAGLHLPTGVVTIESILRHLVAEHGFEPLSANWADAC